MAGTLCSPEEDVFPCPFFFRLRLLFCRRCDPWRWQAREMFRKFPLFSLLQISADVTYLIVASSEGELRRRYMN